MTKTTSNQLELLQSHLVGSVILPGDLAYDEARTIWNGMIDHYPAVILRCRAESDISHSVNYARENKLAISIRGGGHHIAGFAVSQGGAMIDLSQMRHVRVDAANRRAYAQPGATLADLDQATQVHGLATPVGINSTTGIAGLTLGGGIGWLSRKHGLTSDNLVSARIVLADGQCVRASAHSHADLFWALRGGGGNFGVVTEFEFQLHPVGPEILTGLIFFPRDEAGDILRKYRAFVGDAPEDLALWFVLRQAPPLPFLPVSVHGQKIVAFAFAYFGSEREGRKLIAPLQTFGTVLGAHVGRQPYAAWQQAFDPLLIPGARNYWKSHNFLELQDGFFDRIVELASELPSPGCEIFVAHLGGQVSRVPAEATAYGNRNANFMMNVHGRWDSPADDLPGIAWTRHVFMATLPFATGGAYTNFLTADEPERVERAFGPNYPRLAKVKSAYDPQNLFRLNQNIRPG